MRADSPVWIIVCVAGGATVAQQVWPNAVDRVLDDPAVEFTGLSILGWLRALKPSARICTAHAVPSRRGDGKRAGVNGIFTGMSGEPFSVRGGVFTSNFSHPPKRQFVNGVHGQDVGPVEVRDRALVAPRARVHRSARISGRKAAAGRGAGRVHRLDAHKQRIVLVELKKKRVLFLRIGPLASAPYWFNLMSGLGVPWALAKNSLEFKSVLWRNRKALPKAFRTYLA